MGIAISFLLGAFFGVMVTLCIACVMGAAEYDRVQEREWDAHEDEGDEGEEVIEDGQKN